MIDKKLKVAVITGAARGIGLTIARRFHAEAYHVIIIDNNETSLFSCEITLKDQEAFSFFCAMFLIQSK